MKYYIRNTDIDWYRFLKVLAPEDINFWRPGGSSGFRAVEAGSPFLLRLKSPINKIAGIGFFSSHSILPLDFAWEVFGQRNGTNNLSEFAAKIKSYRNPSNSFEKNLNIGCIVLTNPIFFDESDWILVPDDWARSIVQGKTYSTENEPGRRYWEHVEAVLSKYQKIETNDSTGDPRKQYLKNVRIGQGAFRILITDAYSRRCAVSGEKTLPVLEAAHIMPYAHFGLNATNNGLLLRADLHKLFDTGYITVTDKYHIEISNRIREEFENGRDYYKYHGEKLISLPNNMLDMPDTDYLKWHNENVFKI